MLKSCPASVDVTDLQFKLQCRLKVFESDVSSFSKASSLLTCASRYGLLFVGSNSNQFQVIQTNALQHYNPKDKEVAGFPRRIVQLPSTAKHLCVNCDSTVLAVVAEKDQCPIVIFYEVLSFLRQNINVIKEVRLSPTPSVFIREINWNPSLPGIFTACKSDGSLGVYELKGNSVDINELPTAAGTTCFCWSPKGKQIAVGSKDGKITQYKPDLKAVKAIGEPKLEGLHTIINLQWVSNFQFIGVYQSVQDAAAYVIVVDAPKTGEPTYTNYEDICYSGSSRPPQFYLILQQAWNLLMVASANSAEVGVLSNTGESWTQWIMSDSARAELPLTSDHQETLPVGLAFDISSTTPLQWGESTIPPCPMLCILSNYGVLCCFNVVYLKAGIPSICTPPDPVADTTGLSSFVIDSTIKKSVVKIEHPKPQAEIKFGIGGAVGTPIKPPVSSVPLNIPSQSTPLPTANVTPKTLFGDQATITPIKPQQPQTTPLFLGQTSLIPLNKGSNGAISATSVATAQPTNFSEKYTPIFSSLTVTSTPPVSTAPVKPIVISATPVKPEPFAKPQEALIKPGEVTIPKLREIEPKTQVAVPKDVIQRSLVQDNQLPDTKAETSEILSQMIQDEWLYLEAELKVLLNLGRTFKVRVGTDKEKVDMIQQLDSLEKFVKEAIDISNGQCSEIHYLKQNLIQSWAWFEEANSHYNSSKNEAVALLIKLQPLDSLSEKRYKDIKQLIYYADSQVYQVSKALDEQWDGFQNYAKKTFNVKMPTMETIFQTMVRQNGILQKQIYVLKTISIRLRKQTNVNQLLDKKVRDLEGDLQNLCLDSKDILQLQYEKIKNHTKNLTQTKVRKLRDFLTHRQVTRVTAVQPQVSSWTINQSPASKMRQSISRLGMSASPLSRSSSVTAKLDFGQSPISKVAETPSPVQSTNKRLPLSLNTPNKPSFTIAASTPTTFMPFIKSGPGISSSQGSAFTPIGGAASSDKQFFFKTPNESVPASNKFALAASQNVSFPSQVPAATATATTAATKFTWNTSSVSKSDTNTGPGSNNFIFGPSSTKSVLAKPPTAAMTFSSISSSESPQFPSATSSSVFGIKPVASVPKTQQEQSALAAPTTAAAVSIPKSSNGISSISANLQSVIDNATANSAAVASTGEDAKSTLSLPPQSGSATTATTQSAFGSLPTATSTATKPLFGSFTTSNAGSLFGNAGKSVAETAIAQNTFAAIPPQSSTPSTSMLGKLQKLSEPTEASSVTVPQQASEPKSVGIKGEPTTPTNVISVSLFDSKPITSAATSSATSIFGSSAAPSQPGASVFSNLIAPDQTTAKHVTFGIPKTTAEFKPAIAATTTTATAAQPSIFGPPGSLLGPGSLAGPTVSSSTSIFARDAPSASEGSGGSIPAAPSLSTIATTASDAASASKGANIFGSPTTAATTTSNIFAATNVTQLAAKDTGGSGSVFGTDAAPASGMVLSPPGTATAKPVFETSTTTPTPTVPFGAPATATVASAFATAAAPTNVFGAPSSNTVESAASSTNIFRPPTTGSIFGAPPPTTSTTNIFASSATGGSTAFGSPAATKSFDSPTPVVTTSSIFGGTTTAPGAFESQSGSIFGGAAAAGNAFGQPASFGNQAAFGGAQTTTVFGQPGSAFGSANQNPVFGSPTVTATTSGNIFASAATTNAGAFGSGFGAPSTTSAFGAPAPTQPTGAFGFGGLSVDGTSSSGSIFGGYSGGAFAQTPPANPFGKVETKPAFGSNSSSIFGNAASTSGATNAFGTPAATATSIFGGRSEGTFGGAPTTGGAFGSPNVFGQPGPFSSGAFGSPQQGAFSGGGGASPVAQGGFGSPASFPKPSGFGSSPLFGVPPAPAFGATATFGGVSSFGGAPTFGSSSPAGTGGFAAGAQESAGFGNLASQNTIGFGNLAQQQANTPTSMPFSGSSSFSSWR